MVQLVELFVTTQTITFASVPSTVRLTHHTTSSLCTRILSTPYTFACWKLGTQWMVQEDIIVIIKHYEHNSAYALLPDPSARGGWRTRLGCVMDFQSENDESMLWKALEEKLFTLDRHSRNEWLMHVLGICMTWLLYTQHIDVEHSLLTHYHCLDKLLTPCTAI